MVFKVGDAASYTVTQISDSQVVFPGLPFLKRVVHSETTTAFDIKILSSDTETLSYPFDVELTVKEIRLNETVKTDDKTEVICYSSENPEDSDKGEWAKHLVKLIHAPMHFRVNGEFDVKEVTELLKGEFEDSSPVYIGATPWSFEFLLTRSFHLSGEEIHQSASYPVSCLQLINWEDAKLDIEEYDTHQTSSYTIASMDSDTIKGTWQGAAKIKGDKSQELIKGTISVKDNVKMEPCEL